MTWRFGLRRSFVRARRSWREAMASPAEDAGGQWSADMLASIPGLAAFGALAACAQHYVLAVMQCVGPSMLPTIGRSGDVVLMWSTANGWIGPHRGDVVICASPTDPTSTVCKRVHGMPGDVVRWRRLPGMPPPGEGAVRGREASEEVLQVPRGQVWLQGDNSADSCDSRYYGPVPISLVRGIVFLKVWPFTEARWISRDLPLEQRTPEPPPPPRPDPPPLQADRGPPPAAETLTVEGSARDPLEAVAHDESSGTPAAGATDAPPATPTPPADAPAPRPSADSEEVVAAYRVRLNPAEPEGSPPAAMPAEPAAQPSSTATSASVPAVPEAADRPIEAPQAVVTSEVPQAAAPTEVREP